MRSGVLTAVWPLATIVHLGTHGFAICAEGKKLTAFGDFASQVVGRILSADDGQRHGNFNEICDSKNQNRKTKKQRPGKVVLL